MDPGATIKINELIPMIGSRGHRTRKNAYEVMNN
jgi:hypothetical protein